MTILIGRRLPRVHRDIVLRPSREKLRVRPLVLRVSKNIEIVLLRRAGEIDRRLALGSVDRNLDFDDRCRSDTHTDRHREDVRGHTARFRRHKDS